MDTDESVTLAEDVAMWPSIVGSFALSPSLSDPEHRGHDHPSW
jgi:hypothetical protein